MIKIIANYSDRIDKYIANNVPEISRNDIQELIKQGMVLVEGTRINKTKFIVAEGKEITILKVLEKKLTDVKEQNLKLDIVFENDDYLIINKPSGLVVHPAPGHYDQTLVNGLLYHFKNNLSDVNGLLRLGIVHRIDKDTSGLLIIAKNNATHNYLASLLKEHKIERIYYAICDGKLEDKIINIDLPIGRDKKNRQKFCVTNENAKEAYTTVYPIKYLVIDGKEKTLVKCKLKTGRTHQVRVHLAYIGHPIYGDPIYNKKIDDFNQRLHAKELIFIDNKGKEQHFEVDFPDIFKKEIT